MQKIHNSLIFFEALDTEPRTLGMRNKHCTTNLYLQLSKSLMQSCELTQYMNVLWTLVPFWKYITVKSYKANRLLEEWCKTSESKPMAHRS